jgi:O2-independent ubiquinone biosynthesis accessory factor UbiT
MKIASVALATALNLFLRRKLPPELFERLAGREVAIEASEPRVRASFRVRGRHFVPVRPGAEPWLRFRASALDFARIAARTEDADTLFFNRRLVVEGDTEAALLVKNALDCIEAPRTRAVLRRVLRVAGRQGAAGR